MIKLAHGLSNPPRPDSIIGFVKLTTSPSAPLVSTLWDGDPKSFPEVDSIVEAVRLDSNKERDDGEVDEEDEQACR